MPGRFSNASTTPPCSTNSGISPSTPSPSGRRATSPSSWNGGQPMPTHRRQSCRRPPSSCFTAAGGKYPVRALQWTLRLGSLHRTGTLRTSRCRSCSTDQAIPTRRRAFTKTELQSLFGAADDLVDSEFAKGFKRWLPALWDSTAFKIAYAYGLRRGNWPCSNTWPLVQPAR